MGNFLKCPENWGRKVLKYSAFPQERKRELDRIIGSDIGLKWNKSSRDF